MRIVEIGPYTYPLYRVSEKHIRKLNEGASYIVVDATLNGSQVARLWQRDKSRLSFVTADASDLPLPNNIADEIWLLNVFSYFNNETKTVEEGELKACISDCARVLKQRGSIFVGEWYTPEKTEWITEVDFAENNLSKKIYRGSSLQNFMKDLGYQGPASYTVTSSPFLIALTKK